MCLPVEALSGSRESYSISEDELKNKYDYFGTLVALGNLRITNSQKNPLNKAIELLSNITKIVRTAGPAFSSLSGDINQDDIALEALKLLVDGGVNLLSIANPQVSSLVTTQLVQPMVHTMEASGIHWLGLNAKCHHIAVVGGQRVGFIAMCAGHGQCLQSSQTPFAPVKYTSKVATSVVNNIKGYGVEVMVVLLSWGRDSGTYAGETVLPIIRKLAQLGVNVIVGYGPNAVQDHAYFGSTLVIFSMGNLLSYEPDTPYCWKKESGKWVFDDAKEHCKIIHPLARENLLERETHTRVYKLYLSRSQPAMAEYITLPMSLDSNPTSSTHNLRAPITPDTNEHWTTVCGASDTNCLSCKPF
ncbi:uncharacterized protein LOC135348681 isoform X2 [Halichondria panicea]